MSTTCPQRLAILRSLVDLALNGEVMNNYVLQVSGVLPLWELPVHPGLANGSYMAFMKVLLCVGRGALRCSSVQALVSQCDGPCLCTPALVGECGRLPHHHVADDEHACKRLHPLCAAVPGTLQPQKTELLCGSRPKGGYSLLPADMEDDLDPVEARNFSAPPLQVSTGT